MDCEKCGAEIPGNVAKCPECGEPTASAGDETDAIRAAGEATDPTEAPKAPTAEDATVIGEAPDTEPVAPRAGLSPVLKIVLAVVIVAIVAAGGWFAYSRMGGGNTPESAAKAMLTAYGDYDAQGILDNATHESLLASDVAQFAKQAADAKTRAKNLPGVKNISVVKATVDTTGTVTASNPEKATVEVSADWLDPTTGKYTKRNETLIVVKMNGKWVVQLF